MRLLVFAVLILLALIVIFAIRAFSARKTEKTEGQGYWVKQADGQGGTFVQMWKGGTFLRNEAFVSYSDPIRGDKLLEEVGSAQAKADDWNSTNRALSPEV